MSAIDRIRQLELSSREIPSQSSIEGGVYCCNSRFVCPRVRRTIDERDDMHAASSASRMVLRPWLFQHLAARL